jgi:hypothetical protein
LARLEDSIENIILLALTVYRFATFLVVGVIVEQSPQLVHRLHVVVKVDKLFIVVGLVGDSDK